MEDRRSAHPHASYTARLLRSGARDIAQRVGEEAVEAVIAAAAGEKRGLIEESADLLYHLLVLWAKLGIAPDRVWAELARREGTSGIAEKRSRARARPRRRVP
ncbi:MAG: phosphoribosyl-ATP diphosphatase [Alphaproteobacteria bacterium]